MFFFHNPACCVHVDDEREKRKPKMKRKIFNSFVSRSI